VLFNNNVAPGTSSATFTVNAGLVPFSFNVTQTSSAAKNGGGIASGLAIAFAKVSDSVFYVFLDDGGSGRDRDFDDMVVKIVDPPFLPAVPVSAVPLPAALPLFATGLGALGLIGWRRKRKASASSKHQIEFRKDRLGAVFLFLHARGCYGDYENNGF